MYEYERNQMDQLEPVHIAKQASYHTDTLKWAYMSHMQKKHRRRETKFGDAVLCTVSYHETYMEIDIRDTA